MCCRRRLGTTPTRASARSCTPRAPPPISARTVALRTSHYTRARRAAIARSVHTTSSHAHGTCISRPMALARRFWGWSWRSSFLEFTIGQIGLFRAHLDSLVQRQTIPVGRSPPYVLVFAPLASIAGRTQRLNRSNVSQATTVQRALALRCLVRRARTQPQPTSSVTPSVRSQIRAFSLRQAAPNRRRVPLDQR